MEEYIKDAEGFLNKAFEEYEKTLKDNDVFLMRDCAEKAWNSVVLATNYLLGFLSEGKIPKTHAERRNALNLLEKKFDFIKEKNFEDRFAAREHRLHEMCFYNGTLPQDQIMQELEKAKKYIEDVLEITKERR